MATNPDQTAIDDAEFSAAFNEDQSGPREQTDEEAFSNMDESGTSDASTEGEVVTVEGDGKPDGEVAADAGAVVEGEGATTDTSTSEEQVAEPVVETAAADAGADEEEPADPKDLQRKRSWEGRLKAREEELRLREEALSGKKADVTIGDETAPVSDTPGEAVAELAAAVDSGDMTPEQAMKTLEEDFGPEFVKMLSVLVGAKASEAVNSKVGEVSKTMDQLIGEIVDDKARAHFEEIADAHPDFAEINGSEKLAAYMASMSDEDRAKAEMVAADGSARQINKLLDGFKAWAGSQGESEKSAAAAPAPDAGAVGAVGDAGLGMDMGAIDDSAADAAEGVRSTGMALPNAPERDESYESAWSKF